MCEESLTCADEQAFNLVGKYQVTNSINCVFYSEGQDRHTGNTWLRMMTIQKASERSNKGQEEGGWTKLRERGEGHLAGKNSRRQADQTGPLCLHLQQTQGDQLCCC